jgi:hypothetical protein
VAAGAVAGTAEASTTALFMAVVGFTAEADSTLVGTAGPSGVKEAALGKPGPLTFGPLQTGGVLGSIPGALIGKSNRAILRPGGLADQDRNLRMGD